MNRLALGSSNLASLWVDIALELGLWFPDCVGMEFVPLLQDDEVCCCWGCSSSNKVLELPLVFRGQRGWTWAVEGDPRDV